MLLVRLQRTREWCEPGQSQKQKILPERELKSNLLSKGTGLIPVIHDTVYSKIVNWLKQVPRKPGGKGVECGWYRGGLILSFVPELGGRFFISSNKYKGN